MKKSVLKPRGGTAVADPETAITSDDIAQVDAESLPEEDLESLPIFDDSPSAQTEVMSATGSLIGDGVPTIEIKEVPVKVSMKVKNFLNPEFVAGVKIIRRGNTEHFESYIRDSGGRITKDNLEEEVSRSARRYSKDVWDLIWEKAMNQIRQWYKDSDPFSLYDVYEFIASSFPALKLELPRSVLRQQWMSLIEYQLRDNQKRGNMFEQVDLVKLWLKMNGVVFALK